MSNSVMCMTCCKFNEDRNKGKYRLVQNSDVFICCHTKGMLVTGYVDQVVKHIELYKYKFPCYLGRKRQENH